MVIVRLWRPAVRHEESRSDDFLRHEHADLEPYPARQAEDCGDGRVGVEDVGGVGVEVDEGDEAEEGLACDEGEGEGEAAVSEDVAVDLREPEGEVEGGEEVGVDGAEMGGPGCGVKGEEEEGEEEEVEFCVQGGKLTAGCAGCGCWILGIVGVVVCCCGVKVLVRRDNNGR